MLTPSSYQANDNVQPRSTWPRTADVPRRRNVWGSRATKASPAMGRGVTELISYGGHKAASVSIIGFSMGGHWAIWLSQRPELPIRATVVYYSARAGSFKDSHSSFLAHFAEDDPWVSRASRKKMEAEIAKAGRPYKAHDYIGTRHWFAEKDRPREYNVKSASLAFARTIAHLRAA